MHDTPTDPNSMADLLYDRLVKRKDRNKNYKHTHTFIPKQGHYLVYFED